MNAWFVRMGGRWVFVDGVPMPFSLVAMLFSTGDGRRALDRAGSASTIFCKRYPMSGEKQGLRQGAFRMSWRSAGGTWPPLDDFL